MGIARDLVGDYRVTLTAAAALPLLLAVAAATQSPPVRSGILPPRHRRIRAR